MGDQAPSRYQAIAMVSLRMLPKGALWGLPVIVDYSEIP
jgi:hypothetical protein